MLLDGYLRRMEILGNCNYCSPRWQIESLKITCYSLIIWLLQNLDIKIKYIPALTVRPVRVPEMAVRPVPVPVVCNPVMAVRPVPVPVVCNPVMAVRSVPVPVVCNPVMAVRVQISAVK